MIKVQDLNFSTETDEGKMLLAAIAIMTGNPTWSHKIVGDVVEEISDMANFIYYESEWKFEKKRIKRDKVMDSILLEKNFK